MNIQTRELSCYLDNKKILNNISVSIPNKEFIGVIGPNGSGKSTFLKCIYRVLNTDKGVIFFDGVDLYDLSYKQSAKKMAVVAQHNFYSFDFTVLEIVLMGRAPHKSMMELDNAEDYDIAADALKKVDMPEFMHRSFNTLSGGEQQRIILARALVQQTSCLILDEPTNHLDIKYQLQMMDIIKSMNLTVVAAIHDLNIAAAYCDKIIAIQNGQVIGFDYPAQLLTETFISDLYGVKATVQKLGQNRLNIIYQSSNIAD